MTRKSQSAILAQYKQLIMANDPAAYQVFGEYEFFGTLEDRVVEILYNHGYEGASKAAMKPLFDLARQERFLQAAELAWNDGITDGGR